MKLTKRELAEALLDLHNARLEAIKNYFNNNPWWEE